MYEVDDLTNFLSRTKVPDSLLSGKELRTLEFALEQSAGKVTGEELRQGGYCRGVGYFQGHRRCLDAIGTGPNTGTLLFCDSSGMG
jgi:hypothetical protein